MWGRWGTPQNFLLAFTDEAWKTWKIRLLKNEKNCWRYHHFTHMYQKPQSYEIQLLRYEVRLNSLSFWAIFLPFSSPPLPTNNPENQNFEKMRKAFGDAIILNLYKKKHNHMTYAKKKTITRYGVRQTQFLSFQVIFCSFAPLLTLKIKTWKKCKKTPGDIILLHMCTINQDLMIYGSWDMKCNRQDFFVILGNFLAFYPPNSPKNENIKSEKNSWRHHHCTQVYQKTWSSIILFQRYGPWRM